MRRARAAAGLAGLLLLVACGLIPPGGPARQDRALLPLSCQPIAIPGAEDVVVHAEAGVAYVSSTDRRVLFGQREPEPGRPVGHLFRLDLKQTRPEAVDVTPQALRDHAFQPHGLGLLPLPGGQARLFVINHRAPLNTPTAQGTLHSIEILDLPATGAGPLGLRRSGITGPALTNPNDIAPVDGDAFYVTNTDSGQPDAITLLRTLFGIGGGSVVYFDGLSFHPTARYVPFANGVTADPARRLLHVSSSADGVLRSFSWAGGHPAQPAGAQLTGLRGDNMDIPAGQDSVLLLAGHPSALALLRHRRGADTAPSRVVMLQRDADGLPLPGVTLLYESDGVETANNALAAASVMAAWTAPQGGRRRYLLGAILSQRMLLCDHA